MKKIIFAAVCIFAVALIIGCQSSQDGGDSPTVTTRVYNGAGHIGDYITFEVNATDFTWSYTNLTSPETLFGTYGINANGTYLATIETTGAEFAVLELPDIALICPISTESGVLLTAATLKGDFSQSDLLGEYVFVDFLSCCWGTFEIKADNTIDFTYYAVATPEYTVVTSETNVAYTYNNDGTITFPQWPAMRVMVSPAGVMIVDNGPGLGMMIGVEKPTSSITWSTGTYNCMDQSSGIVGICSLESSGQMSWDFEGMTGGGA
ncbi:MAG: hypothetical protein ABH835_04585, partial [Patescibacteria group bacterium]